MREVERGSEVVLMRSPVKSRLDREVGRNNLVRRSWEAIVR